MAFMLSYKYMKRLTKGCLMIALVGLLSFLISYSVYAAECGGVETNIISCDSANNGIWGILSLVINIMTAGIGVLAVIGIVICGIQYTTAAGDEAKTRKAKRRMFEIVIGVAAYLILFAAFNWLSPNGVEVENVRVESVTINPSSITLDIGQTKNIKVAVQPYNANYSSIKWESSSSSVVSVNNYGKVTARSAGTAVIKATIEDRLTASVSISVRNPVANNGSYSDDEGSSGRKGGVGSYALASIKFPTDFSIKDIDYNTILTYGAKISNSVSDATWKNGNECDGKTIYPGKKYTDLDNETILLFAAMVKRENCSSSKSDELGCKLLASQIINLYEQRLSEGIDHTGNGLKYWLTHSEWYASTVRGPALDISEAHQLAIDVTKHVLIDGNRYLPLFVNRFDGAYHWTEHYDGFYGGSGIYNAIPMVTEVKKGKYFWCIEGKTPKDEVFDYEESYRRKLEG